MKQLLSKRRYNYFILGICALLYTVSTLLGPIGNKTYGLTNLQIRLLQLTIIIPIILIWIAAFIGAVGFRVYAESIKKSLDGRALLEISKGLMILAFGLVVNSLFGTLKQTMLQHNNGAMFSIVSNYLSVGFALAAFYEIFRGSEKLFTVKGISTAARNNKMLAIAGLIIISILYTFALLRTPYRNHSPDPQVYNSYYLPDWLIIITIILPYVLCWAMGVLAVVNLVAYKAQAKGTIYRAALNGLIKGILAITFFSIALQFFTALMTSLQTLSVGFILGIIYIIIVLYAVGFLFVAAGVKKLARIEEV